MRTLFEEEDEGEVIDLTQLRVKTLLRYGHGQRVQADVLAKDLKLSVEEVEKSLNALMTEGVVKRDRPTWATVDFYYI